MRFACQALPVVLEVRRRGIAPKVRRFYATEFHYQGALLSWIV